MKIDAKFSGNLNNSSLLTLDIVGTVLQPTKTGEPNMLLRESLPVDTPTFTPSSWDSGSTLSVTLATTTPGASIYYTTDGTTPTSASTAYSSAISLSATTTIKAVAIKDGNSSDVATKSYTKPGA